MQFTLKYILRHEEALKGAYYIGCSFCGEDPDQTQLNRCYQAQRELLGTLNVGINVAKRYITNIARAILKKHADIVPSVAGDTTHAEDLISLSEMNDGHLPRIILPEALSLNEINKNEGAWEHAVSTNHSEGACSKTRR